MRKLQKIHHLSTLFAAIGGFMFVIDSVYRMNVLPRELENVAEMLGLLFFIIFLLSTAVSILLSLYTISRK